MSTELVTRLQAAAAETPYAVTPTSEGFRMDLDIVDARWWTVLHRNGIDKAYTIDGHVDDAARTVETTDTMRELQWQAGADATTMQPRFGSESKVARGEVRSFTYGKQLGVDDSGQAGEVAAWKFSSGEMKGWLDGQLEAAGYRRAMGAEARTAIRVAIGAGVLVAIIAVVLVVAALVS